MSAYGLMPGRYPGVVKEYLQNDRMVRVEIPGLTDGADVLPLAEIEYPIGDKSKAGDHSTEIEIVAGDNIWLAFIGGDPRYPIMTGFRNPKAGNSVDWRRWHHKNMELLADELMNLIAGTKVTIDGPQVVVNCQTAQVNASESATIDSPTTNITQDLNVGGNVNFNGGSVKHAGVEIGKDHGHLSVQPGSGVSGVVKP